MTEPENKYPLLSKIDSPADLRKLELEELPALCQEIRQFLIDELSVHPGHFASSMGAVELTVALHYVFDTPYDRIVWDVGHQAYGHKLLTGRRDAFHTNRTRGGLSGFPNPDESEYDTFTAGHASNSISAALGMAVASKLQGDNPRRNVIAVIGDASISGGLAFEGLNNAANMPNNLLVILNDNDMSIDANVGSLNSYLGHFNTSPTYNRMRYRTFNFLKKMRLISDKNRGRILRFNNSIKSVLSNEQNIFEGLNLRYFGPFDGHDIFRIVRVLTDIKNMDGPRLLHLRTVKGKGYAPAEENPAEWHAPGKFDPKTGVRQEQLVGPQPDKPLKYQDVFGHTLLQLAEADPKIVAITAAMLSGTSISIMQKAMPQRVFDVGISEGHAVTFAGGLAKDGMKPVVGIYSSFLQRAFDNIVHDVAIQRLHVTFCIDRAGLVGEDGVTHHGALDLAYMRTVPNMVVSAASDEAILRDLMYTALEAQNGPFSIRYPRGAGQNPKWNTPMKALPIGKGRKLRDGNQVALLSIGTIAVECEKAAKLAFIGGVSAAHYDMIFLKPIDHEILDEIGAKGIPVVTVEDGTIKGGLGSAVLEYFAEKGYDNHVTVLGLPDRFVKHGTVAEQKAEVGLDPESISKAIIAAAK
ncbi:MAG: 1-deoxy-D-xylulose-5-phosphate synthase [Bacteroidales bacterium]|nr:1-deoxy-D-xylulose-5-phosphate synthase [Bacteroidales bacterium]